MNKKGLSTILMAFFTFAFFALIYTFSTVFVYEVGEDFIIKETADVGREIFTNVSPDAQRVQNINNLETKYQSYVFPYDLYFLASWISIFSFTIWSSYRARKQNVFSFFGSVFIGSLLMLLITSFIAQFTDWFMENLFNPVFADSTISIPIITFYLTNMALINMVWWGILILVNVLDLSFVSRSGREEE